MAAGFGALFQHCKMARAGKLGQDGAMRAIDERRGVTRARFEGEIVPAGEPVVLRGLVADWPLVAAGAEALPGLLRAGANDVPSETWFAEPGRRGRFGFAADFGGYDHDRRMATIAQTARPHRAAAGGDGALCDVRGRAAGWRGTCPAFARRIGCRLLDDKGMLVSLWLGTATRTAAHFDFPDNLACVIAGRRRFTLFPAEQAANLYIGPLDVTLAGQPSSLADVEEPGPRAISEARGGVGGGADRGAGAGGRALRPPSLWVACGRLARRVGGRW